MGSIFIYFNEKRRILLSRLAIGLDITINYISTNIYLILSAHPKIKTVVPVLLVVHSIYYGVTRTLPKSGSICIKRTLRMRSWLADCFTDAKSKKENRYTDCSYHSNSLSNKMGNSLLAVREINHKYIVVGGFIYAI